MAKYEFGIMQSAPEKGKRYDEYEPQKYDCISVNDDYLEDLSKLLKIFMGYQNSGNCRKRLLFSSFE